MGTATQVICHDSKSKLINMGGHVATAAVSAAALAALFKYVRQPSLAVLTGSSVACIALPAVTHISAQMTLRRMPDNDQKTFFHPFWGKKLIRMGLALSGFVGGAQMVFIGFTALRTWNSGLSGLKKMGVGVALTASIAELVVVKGCGAMLLAYEAANRRQEGNSLWHTYDPNTPKEACPCGCYG